MPTPKAEAQAPLPSQQWQVVELNFEAERASAQPFDEEFGAVFTQSDGARLSVPGFYNGGTQWLLRFCPPKTGTWNYQTWSSLPGLSGRAGTVAVAPNQTGHGPIGISAHARQKFAYADGTPYFTMAFELDWLFALDAENAAGIPRARGLVDDVARHGFNQIVMNVFAYDANWGEKDKIPAQYNFARPRVFPFGGDNQTPDHSTLDVEFFQRLDRVIAYLNQKQIAAHLMIYVWNKGVNWPDARSQDDNRYFDYVAKRYQAYPNVIWDISKEALGYGHDDMSYITDRIERLRRLDAHRRLVTVHDYDYCSAFPDKVDFISIQEWTPYLYDRMLEVKAAHPTQPIFNIEHGAYEKTLDYSVFDGAYVDPLTALDRAYQCVFAGTYPTYYWQNAAWYNVNYRPFELPREQQPNFNYYRHLTRLFEEYPFDKLQPLRRPFSPPALTDGAGLYLFYVPGDRTGLYGTFAQFKGKTMKVRWFDALTGEFTEGGTKSFEKGGWLGVKRPAEVKGPLNIAILSEVEGAGEAEVARAGVG